jgi:aminopeptidase N
MRMCKCSNGGSSIKLVSNLLVVWYLLTANTTLAYTHADTLRGSNGRGRDWWDVQRYALSVDFDLEGKSIKGSNVITFNIINVPSDSLQIDLQEPMILDAVKFEGENLEVVREGNVWWVKYPFHELKKGSKKEILLDYHGKPRTAVNPPWDGGFSWTTDDNGKPWIAVSCQGLGASVWWPCKDAQWDEPDNGVNIKLTAPEALQVVSNGKLVADKGDGPGNHTAEWSVKDPVNTYDVTFYIGDYVHWHDTLLGEKGKLDLDFWVLRDNLEKAKKQFEVVKPMIHCFEYWMGPYPFYEDGYKLVEAPYLGMEHQGAIAYGNKYRMGYEGYDRTNTGVGMNFDYIIVHESGHEWFGNNVTAKDIADNWIHEGITTFSECLFVECQLGKEKALKYCRGEWRNIQNNRPIISDYGVNKEGYFDMYDKGAAMMYMIRMMTNDDEKFRQMLRGLGRDFYHQTVTTEQVEHYIAKHTGLDLKAFFNQYLRTAGIPEIEYYIKDGMLNYKFNNTVKGFSLPVAVSSGECATTIVPTDSWKHIKWKGGYDVKFSKDFLFTLKE